MFIVAAVVLSILLMTVTGCASKGPSVSTQEAGKKNPVKKTGTYDQNGAMNEESMNAVR
jgi:predicted small lipoprotein YifL